MLMPRDVEVIVVVVVVVIVAVVMYVVGMTCVSVCDEFLLS